MTEYTLEIYATLIARLRRLTPLYDYTGGLVFEEAADAIQELVAAFKDVIIERDALQRAVDYYAGSDDLRAKAITVLTAERDAALKDAT
jgi:hypothetical protein